MRINKHVCSIFIEEEANGCEGRGYNGNPYADDSTDSVSSLDTYVEDIDFFEVNGEEKGRQRIRDECWPEGGDGREKNGGDDEQYWPKSNFCFEGSTSKSKGYQGKGGLSFTNGESLGQKANESNVCVCLPAPDCDWNSYSNPNLADLAKVVVDIECLSNQKKSSEGLGRVCMSEAQLSGGGPHGSAQKNVRNEGLVIPTTFEGFETRESHNEGDKLKRRQVEGLEVRASLEEWEAHNKRISPKMANETQYGASSGESGQQICIVMQGGSQHEVATGAMVSAARISNLVGSEVGVAERSKSSSPPRHRKKKGLTEFGDSCPFPRRSGRIKARMPQAGAMVHNTDEVSSSSISDKNIYICNSRLDEPDDRAGPSKLWEVGKQVGIRCCKEENEVVREYGNMEVRDSEVASCSKTGNKNLS